MIANIVYVHAGFFENLTFDAVLKRLARLQEARQRTVEVARELLIVAEQDLVVRLVRDGDNNGSICSWVVDVMQTFPVRLYQSIELPHGVVTRTKSGMACDHRYRPKEQEMNRRASIHPRQSVSAVRTRSRSGCVNSSPASSARQQT